MPVNILKWDPLAHLYAFLQPHLAAQFNQRLGRGLAKRRTLPVIIVPPTLSGAHHHECCWVSHQAPATLHLTTSCWPVIQAGQECWEVTVQECGPPPRLRRVARWMFLSNRAPHRDRAALPTVVACTLVGFFSLPITSLSPICVSWSHFSRPLITCTWLFVSEFAFEGN